MGRLPNILKFVNSALDGIKSIEKQIVGGTAVLNLEKEIWMVYKDCESAVFLVKLEISDVEASDNTNLQIDVDRLGYTITLAEDHLNNASQLIEEGKMKQTLEQLRYARNIMAEVYSHVNKDNRRAIRNSFKSKEKNV